MTTINLRDGLETLYYFGEKDFDPQRNQLKDHSGYGRHATANGGPTVGVNGPNDFEAASFDGNDDFFDVPNYITPVGSGWTIAFLVRLREGAGQFNYITDRGVGTEDGVVLLEGGHISYDRKFREDEIQTPTTLDAGEWGLGVIRRKPNSDEVSAHLVENDSLNTGIGKATSDAKRLEVRNIANAPNKSKKHFDGQIAFIGIWSRRISIPETRYLSDLTAPQRSQL